MTMKIEVEVDLYRNGGKDSVRVILNSKDIAELAEAKALKDYEALSAQTKHIEIKLITECE